MAKTIDRALRAEDSTKAQDAYSLSKLQAEQILQEESRRWDEWVIIRPPLVYGVGVKGNLTTLKFSKISLSSADGCHS